MQDDASSKIEQLETDLWAAADNLRANSKLTSSEYCMPVLGVIFLRRYDAAAAQIVATLRLPKEAQYRPRRIPNRRDG